MPFYRKLTEYCAKKIFNPDFPIIEINRDTPKSTISNFIKIHLSNKKYDYQAKNKESAEGKKA